MQDVIRGYPDDSFRPTAAVTRQAAAAFLYRLARDPEVSAGAGFDDVPADHPFHDAIAWMVERDITSGYDNNTFRPTAPVTRQAAAAFLWRFDGAWEAPFEVSFSDVDDDHPFYTAIGFMAWMEISTGWPDNTFRPNDDVRTAVAGLRSSRRRTASVLVVIDPQSSSGAAVSSCQLARSWRRPHTGE